MAEREREVIVTDGGRSGGSTALIAVVLLIAVLGLLFYLFGQDMINGKATDINADINIDTPATNK